MGSIAPVLSEAKGSKSFESITVQDITDYAFNPASFLVKYADFDVAEDKYMAISLNYRGDVRSKEANQVAQWIKANNKVTFVDLPHRFQDRPQRRAPGPRRGRRHRRLPEERRHDRQQRRRQPRVLPAPGRQVRPHVLPARVRPLVRWRGYGGG